MTPSTYLDADPFALTRQRRAEQATERRLAFEAKYGPTRIYGKPRLVREPVETMPDPSSPYMIGPRMTRLLRIDGQFASKIGRLFKTQHGRCYLCAEKFTPLAGPTRDHVVPRSRRGGDDGNVLLAHARCNGEKSDRMPTRAELYYLGAVYAVLATTEPDRREHGSGQRRKAAEFAVAMAEARRLRLAA